MIYLNRPLENTTLTELVKESICSMVTNYAESVIVLTCLAGSITYEELFSVYGYMPSIFRAKIFPGLIHDGYLAQSSFKSPVGSSFNYYTLTAKGLKKAAELLQDGQRMPARVKSDVGVHSYLVGYNLYQLIRNGFGFRWYKESPYTNPEKIGLSFKSGWSDLRTDAVAVLDDRILRIEEDRRMENNEELSLKILSYEKCGCFVNNRDILVFSIRSSGADTPALRRALSDSPFSRKRCEDLFRYMSENDVEDAALLLGHPELFPKQDYLAGFISHMRGHYGDRPFSLSFVKEILAALSSGVSQIQQEDYNIIHAKASEVALRSCAGYFKDKKDTASFYLSAMRGIAVGFAATTLLSGCIPYLMLDRYPYEAELVARYLDAYFPGAEFEGLSCEPFFVGDYGNILIMRNHFVSADGTDIAVEFPSIDMASWIRCREFTRYLSGSSEKPLQVVCFFKDKDSARAFFEYCTYDAPEIIVDKGRAMMYGVIWDYIENNDPMFTFIGSDEKDYVPLLPSRS